MNINSADRIRSFLEASQGLNDLAFRKSVGDLMHPDASTWANYPDMLIEFETRAMKLMTLPYHLQESEVKFLSAFQHPSAIKLWAIVMGAACTSSAQGDLFLHYFQPPTFPEEAWTQLIPSLGKSVLYKVSLIIACKGFDPQIVQGGWGALRHSIACASIESAFMILRTDGQLATAALFPVNSVQPLVQQAMQVLDTVNSCEPTGEAVSDIIDKAIEKLEGCIEPNISQEVQQNLTDAGRFLTIGINLIYSTVTGPDDVAEPIRPLKVSTVDLVSVLAYAASLDFLARDPDYVNSFTAFYLMDDRSSLLRQDFNGAANSSIFELVFRYVALSTFDVLKLNFQPFSEIMANGILSASCQFLAIYTLNSNTQEILAAHLGGKLSEFHAQIATQVSKSYAVPFYMGWNQKEGAGHALWGIVDGNTVQLINSGAGLRHHRSFASRRGSGKLFVLSKTIVASSEQELHDYLRGSFLLSVPGYLENLAVANSQPTDPSSLNKLAIRVLYETMPPGQEKDDEAAHQQKSITCAVKSLKFLIRRFFPEQRRDFHVVGKLMVYSLWHGRLDRMGRAKELKTELRQTLAKELFRRLVDSNTEVGTLSQLVHYFCTDLDWLWESSSMIHHVYTVALAANEMKVVTFWLNYLFQKSSPIAAQCLADILNSYFTTGDLNLCCRALRKAVNSTKDLETFYSNLHDRMPRFAEFPWQRIALLDFQLAEKIRRDMAANPKSALVLSLFDQVLSQDKENYCVTSFIVA